MNKYVSGIDIFIDMFHAKEHTIFVPAAVISIKITSTGRVHVEGK